MRWWQKDVGLTVGWLIAIFFANLVFSFAWGAYQGFRDTGEYVCVHVKQAAAEDYMVCGKPKPIEKRSE